MTTNEHRAELIADLDESLSADAPNAIGVRAVFVDNYFTSAAAARLGESLGWIRYQDGAHYVTGDGLRAVAAYRAA